MADAEAVAAALPRGEVSWIGLVLNERGLDRAIAAGMDEVNVVVVATRDLQPAESGHVGRGRDQRRGRLWRAGQGSGTAHHRDDRGRLRLPLRGRGDTRDRAATSSRGASTPVPTRSHWPTRSASAFRRQVEALADVAAERRSRVAAALAFPQHPKHRVRQRLCGVCSAGQRRWTPASAGSVGAPSRPPRPGTWPPRTCCTCCTAAASAPASTRSGCTTSSPSSPRRWDTRYPASCPEPAGSRHQPDESLIPAGCFAGSAAGCVLPRRD